MKSSYIKAGIFAAVVAGLFLVSWYINPARGLIGVWNKAGVGCLPNGHQNLAQHIHPRLAIIADGRPELVPPNIGVVQSCMAEMHTHSADGEIHIESTVPGKEFTLAQFFQVWGISIAREGFTVTMKVNGAPSTEFGNLILKDHDEIVLEYSSGAPAVSTTTPPLLVQ